MVAVGGRRVRLDLESTGTDPDHDRIVQIAILESPGNDRFHSLINPGVPIPASATDVHGITDDEVRDAPSFADVAAMVQKVVTETPSDTGPPVILTFNGRRFDVPLLDAELRRAGQPGFPRDEVGRILANDIDLYAIWVQAEKRDLSAAVKRFVGRDHDDAHSAIADAEVLEHVLAGMGDEFGFDAADTAAMVELSVLEGVIDRAGKFRKDGGRVVFNFGKYRDEDVRLHVDYLEWMLEPGRDFPEETQAVAHWLKDRYGGQRDVRL